MNHAIEPYHSGVFDLPRKLTVEKFGHTALITLDHPPANTWDWESLIGLEQVLAHINRDDEIYALIITGRGGQHFCSGADIAMLADSDAGQAWEFARLCGDAFQALRDFRGLSIAAINGLALGAGLECALACDIRIAERHAQLGLPQAAIGLLPCGGGAQALSWLVGESRAKRMIMLAERLDAVSAERVGLIDQLAESGEARGQALLMAQRLAQQSPVALRAVKPLIDASRKAHVGDHTATERDTFVALFQAEDTREGIRAFIEQRDPIWRNR